MTPIMRFSRERMIAFGVLLILVGGFPIWAGLLILVHGVFFGPVIVVSVVYYGALGRLFGERLFSAGNLGSWPNGTGGHAVAFLVAVLVAFVGSWLVADALERW